MLLILLRYPIGQAAFYLIKGGPIITHYAKGYYLTRIYGAPANLINYVLIGTFIGLQDTLTPLLIMVVINLTAIILASILALNTNMAINGIASADVAAQYIGVFTGFFFLSKKEIAVNFLSSFSLSRAISKRLLCVNRDIFIRTLLLIFAFSFFTVQSSRLGSIVVASNTILLNFFVLMAYAQDGFANTAEALIGNNIGQKHHQHAKRAAIDTAIWALLVSTFFILAYSFSGKTLVATYLPEKVSVFPRI